MADPMRIRAVLQGDSTEVRVLMSHEMETGQRKDAQGKVIPAWFIQNVTATWNGKTVLAAEWGPAVAKNPFVSFKFKGGAVGDKVTITWTDNRGDKRTDAATIALPA
jgi:sulfur-oxidizing protein SoxZ